MEKKITMVKQGDFRSKVAKRASILVAVVLLILSIANFYIDNVLFASVQLVLGLSTLYLYINANRLGNNDTFYRYFVFSFAIIVLWGGAKSGVSGGLFMWHLAFPALAYLLLGVKSGASTVLIYLFTTLALMYLGVANGADTVSSRQMTNFLLSFTLMWGFFHINENQRARMQKDLATLASTDALTGLKNRLELDRVFSECVVENKETNQSLNLAIVDVDLFKQVNDEFGHDIGDQVLVELAELLSKNLRDSDAIFRVGGEEFCLLLPNCEQQETHVILERLRQAVENASFSSEEIKITVTIGVSEYSSDGHSFKTLYKVADERLYRAKGTGRNQIAYETARKAFG